MLHLIPQVKELAIKEGFLAVQAVSYDETAWEDRVAAAARKLPYDPAGVPMEIVYTGEDGTVSGTDRSMVFSMTRLRIAFTSSMQPR